MMKMYSFPCGGISYEDHTAPLQDSSKIAFLPTISIIPLVQNDGDRLQAVVSIGDTVKEGMLIGWGHTNIHAAVPGRVIRRVFWKNACDQEIEALVIRMGGSFEKLGKREDIFPWDGLSSHDLRRIVSDCGVVEMEGSGRPLAEALRAGGREKRSLVVRCVFDDPWLAADHTLCRERSMAVVEGSLIAAKMAGVNRIVFVFSHRELELGKIFLRQAGGIPSEDSPLPVSLVITGSRYPQRNRRELEIALRNYEKREMTGLGSLMILGPATLAAIYDAVRLRKPVLDRYIAVGGSAVKKPQVMRVRIGTRIGEVFAECGGFVAKPRRIASGSPLQGRIIVDLDEPVMKTTYAAFAMLDNHAGFFEQQNCIGCGECRIVCPVGLDPEELYKKIGRNSPAGQGPGQGCHGCGCCELVCPSRIPLAAAIYSTQGAS
ncbi:MAG: SLBB domain-containing protein [Treponema sp.]|jgi:electron transport complex protein RnfC|nr:SLBB domain-containing protein [Treponema sp.]